MILDEKKERSKLHLSKIRNLPSIPTVVIEVTKVLENPRASAKDLSKIINQDQGLVAKVLTIANSPLYGLPRRVSTVEFAVVVLGFEQIKNLTYALTLMEAFKSVNSKYWNKKKFWTHAFVVGMLSKKIADDLGYPKAGEALTAGLLHDLGISVIQRYFVEEFEQICQLVEKEQMLFINAEKRILGLTHEEIGQLLINKWNLPQTLADAIRYHHYPSAAKKNRQISAIVHFADYMTQVTGIGDFDWDENIILDNGIVDILELGNNSYLSALVSTYSKIMTNEFKEIYM
ncbi:MAG: HDOD domain-containing protein [Ignavibacteria bacterium]|nr:MAG: HDOD domain-containing protein [Ignavibacteria bacterium]